MMLTLPELVDLGELDGQIEQGYISVRKHPESEALVIYNYSKKAGYERAWNPTVRNCRGLIVDHVNDEVKARPWPKFFNYEEPGADTIKEWEEVAVQDKLDGSLGIIYTAPDGLPAVATRGSFTSDQALWATDFLRSRAPEWRPNPLMTYLVEIIYPDNRIVVDYGNREDLVLLDAYHTNHLEQSPDPLGRVNAYHYWPFGQADLLGFMTFNEFMANLPNFQRENAEGVVVSTRDGRRLKFKQDDYVEKHRMVTNLNPITVWRHMQDNDYRYERLFQDLPEEFQGYVQQQGDALIQTAHTMIEGARMDLKGILKNSQDRQDRKYLASKIKDTRDPALVFALLDNKDPMAVVWKRLRPRL